MSGEVLLALSSASRLHRPEDQGDIKALSDIEHRVEAELERLEKMSDLAAKIEKHARDLQEEARKGSKKLDVLLRNAKSTLKALNVELDEATAEGVVIVAKAESLAAGRRALADTIAEVDERKLARSMGRP